MKPSFPAGMEIAIYEEKDAGAFSGSPSTKCAWRVISSHPGDIRLCPAR